MMKRILLWMGMVVFLVAVISCGGGGDGDGGGGGTCEEVAGTWDMTEVVDATDCGDGTYTENITYTVTQNGCNITVVPSSNPSLSFSGSVNNDRISWKGSWPEDGGTVTATIDITINGNSLSGSATWSWTDGSDSCSGTTQLSGTRTGGGGGGTASVRFFNNLTCNGTNFTATLTFCGQTLTSVSGNWSSCHDITPGTCTLSVNASTGGCGTLSDSMSYSITEGSVYNFALDLSGGNPALGVNEQTGDCSTTTPWRTSVSEIEAGLEKIEAVMDTFEYIPGLQSID